MTPLNNVLGPYTSVEAAQSAIPDSKGVRADDHATDMKACCANLRAAPGFGADWEIEHVETWVGRGEDPDENGYLVFSASGGAK